MVIAPGLFGELVGDVVAPVAVLGVLDDDDVVDGEVERHFSFDRPGELVAGLADAGRLFAGGGGLP